MQSHCRILSPVKRTDRIAGWPAGTGGFFRPVPTPHIPRDCTDSCSSDHTDFEANDGTRYLHSAAPRRFGTSFSSRRVSVDWCCGPTHGVRTVDFAARRCTHPNHAVKYETENSTLQRVVSTAVDSRFGNAEILHDRTQLGDLRTHRAISIVISVPS